MNLESIFDQLNLSSQHLTVYLALLEKGESSMSKLAAKAGLPRTSAYPLVDQLVAGGLAKKQYKGGKNTYVAADPEVLLTLIKKKRVELDQSLDILQSKLSELKAMQKTDKKSPKIQFLEGSEGIKQAYDRSLEAKGEVLIQCLTDDYKDVVSERFFDQYFDKFFKQSNIRSRELLTLDDQNYIDKYGSEKNLQRMVPTKGKVETDIMIYDGSVTFVSFNKERPYAIVIEDEDLANSMGNMFELAWERAGG